MAYAWVFPKVPGPVLLQDSFRRTGYYRTSDNPRGEHRALDLSRYYLDNRGWRSLGGQVIALAVGGKVVDNRYDPDWGYTCKIKGEDGKYWRYAHLLKKPSWRIGDCFPTGYRFGYVGNSGRSTGPHLHIEVSLSSSRDPRQNPFEIFKSFTGGKVTLG